MQTIIGVDQGSSFTRAAVSTERGEILGVGITHGGYGSWHPERAMRAIREAVAQARQHAGLDATPAAVLVGGLTGADWPDEYEQLHGVVSALGLAQTVEIFNDSIVAMRGGTSQPYGVVVIAGTGGNCAVRAPDGTTFIYHYYIDDDLQGGGALGRRALRAIYRAESGREPPTILTREVLALMALPTVDALLRADVEGKLTREVKQIAPLIFAAAVVGDAVARQILCDFGAGLAELVVAGLRRMGMSEMAVEVVLSGSVFKGRGTLLEEVMARDIQRGAPLATLVPARYEPVVGAVLLGIERLGVTVDEPIRAAIEQSSQHWKLIREKESEYGSD